MQAADTFAITIPVIAETLFGIGLLPPAVQNLAEWRRLRSSLICYVPDEAGAENAAALRRALRRQGWQLETVDGFVAVTALRYNLVLLTSDKDFVPVPGLQQENWLMP